MSVKGFTDILNIWLKEFPNSYVPRSTPARIAAFEDLLTRYKEAGYTRSQISKRTIIDNCYNRNSAKAKTWRRMVEREFGLAFSSQFPDLEAVAAAPVEGPEPEVVASQSVETPSPIIQPNTPISEADMPPRPNVYYDDDMDRILGFKK